ncbi:hypothetical protein BJ170DRAFT_624967 [Xylariales sp. AK1849]|nr:hypothetical protein BJ170DRAFT_624967 [Xylariales sp. AK1849]
MVFVIMILLASLLLGRLSQGAPSALEKAVGKRNPCDGVNYKPILYHDYTETDCPAGFHLQKNGDCDGWHLEANECATFCQIIELSGVDEDFFKQVWLTDNQGITFFWGTESPFSKSTCHWPLKCSISESDSTSWSISFSGSPKVGKALKVGISGGFSYGQSTAYGRSWEFEPAKDQCGYFTFVPVLKTTCGTLSQADWIYMGNNPDDYICNANVQTNSAYCAPEAWKPNNTPDGVVLFVWTDCTTQLPLPPDHQDPVYNLPGVALPHEVAASTQQAWVENTCVAIEGNLSGVYTYDFTVQGSGFALGRIDDNGELLHNRISQCGAGVFSYTFAWTPEDEAHDFRVDGTVRSVSVKSCIGDAITAVGGTTKDQCM